MTAVAAMAAAHKLCMANFKKNKDVGEHWTLTTQIVGPPAVPANTVCPVQAGDSPLVLYTVHYSSRVRIIDKWLLRLVVTNVHRMLSLL